MNHLSKKDNTEISYTIGFSFQKIQSFSKQTISKAITELIRFLHRIDNRFIDYANNPNDNGYVDLTPNNDVDGDKKYSNTLLWAIRNKKVKNIGLTGPYGAGKSSILRTFEKRHKEVKFLNISLAPFSKNEEPSTEKIESAIVQQIFYREKDSKIPDSRYKKIKNQSSFQLIFKTLGIFLCGMSIAILFMNDFLSHFNLWEDLKHDKNFDFEKLNNLATLCLTGFSFWFLYQIIRFASKTIISKINLTNSGINISQEFKSEVFNKHLDEILYFFEKAKYDVVVFEDLDRFSKSADSLLTDLRELCTLINQSKQINRHVVFIYAVKDELFVEKTRTKFFDFIIPVVPYVNSSNSFEIFWGLLKVKGLEHGLDKNFVEDVMLYIDDMRLLNNIYNEYIFYKDLIGEKLNQNKLLAMTIYKNLMPEDFAKLQDNKGLLNDLINNKEKYLTEKTDEIDSKIESLKQTIKASESIVINDIKELRSIYIAKLFDRIISQSTRGIKGIVIKNQTYLLDALVMDDTFNLLQKESFILYFAQYGNENSNLTFTEIEKSVNPKITYKEREREILENNNGKTEKRKIEIEELEREKQSLRHKPLNAILDETEFNSEKRAFKFLILNGHMDEQYHDYLSYFHIGSLTKKDREFVLDLRAGRINPIDYKLQNTGNIVKKLNIREFSKKEVLNIDLLDFLFENDSVYKIQVRSVISNFKRNEPIFAQFIDSYMSMGKNPSKFIQYVCESGDWLWEYIENDTHYSEEKKLDYLKYIINHVDISRIKRLNKNSILANFIASFEDILQWSAKVITTKEKIKSIISELDIVFPSLTVEKGHDNSLFDFIVNNNHYKLNPKMIETIIINKNSNKDCVVNDLSSSNFTTINTSNCESLKAYIQKDINTYIKEVFLTLETNINESESSIVWLLNNERISIEEKGFIINKQNNIINDISGVPTDLWDILISNSKIKANWENVYAFYRHYEEITPILVDYLNKEANYKQLSLFSLEDYAGGEFEQSSFDAADMILPKSLLLEDNLSDECYIELLNSIHYKEIDLDVSLLSSAPKVHSLIAKGILGLSQQNFINIRESHGDLCLDLILKHQEEYIKTHSKYALDSNHYYTLLSSNSLTKNNQVSTIKFINIDTIEVSEKLSIWLTEFILNNKEIEWDYKLIIKIIETNHSLKKKIKLLVAFQDLFTPSNISFILSNFDAPYPSLVIKELGSVKIDISDFNIELLKVLEKFRFVSSYKEKNGILTVNRKLV